MDNQYEKGLLKSAGVLALGLVVGLAILGYALASSRAGDKTLTVTGSVKKQVTSDLAKWIVSLNMKSDLNSVRYTIDASNKKVEAVKQFAKSLGLTDADITVDTIQTDPVYEQNDKGGYGYYGPTGNLAGYVIRQNITVMSKDVGKVELLAKRANELSGQGIIFDNQRTEFYYTKLSDLRPQLYADATSDARTRAMAIARGTGATVGSLHSARTGVIQVLPVNSTEVADYGAYDLNTKEKEVTATVSASFDLK